MNPRFIGQRLLGEAPLRPKPPQIRRHEHPSVDRPTRILRMSFEMSPAFHAGNMDFG